MVVYEDVALRQFRLGVLSHQLPVLADPLLATAECLESPSLFPRSLSPLCSFFFTQEALFQQETLLPFFVSSRLVHLSIGSSSKHATTSDLILTYLSANIYACLPTARARLRNSPT